MFREMTMTTVAMVMLASTAFAAPNEKMGKENRPKEEVTKEAARIESTSDQVKNANAQMRIFREASEIVGEAGKSSKCDPTCVRTIQALEKVARNKADLGLSDTIKPEKTIHDVWKNMKSGMSIEVALAKSIEDNKVKQDKLLDCAGK